MPPAQLPEVWLRGPLPEVPPLLQPVAHALLQAREEVNALMENFPEELLWQQPAGTASPGFHLQHLTGVLDRLCTYAWQQQLTNGQLQTLSAEGRPGNPATKYPALVEAFNNQVDKALAQLRTTSEQDLLQARGVGRAQLPSIVLGLLVHAAEHTQRHVGQLTVTVRVLKWLNPSGQ